MIFLKSSKQAFTQLSASVRTSVLTTIGIVLLTGYTTPAWSQVTFSATTLPAGMDYAGASGNGAVQVADFNNDGYPDFVYAITGEGISYFQNFNWVSFSTPPTHPFGALATNPPTGTVFNASSSVADFDGDGDLDIWIRIHGDNNDIYFRNNGSTFTFVALPAGMEYSPAAGSGTVKVDDINQDGLPDIIYTSSVGGPIVYIQNNNGTSFSTPASNPFAAFLTSTPPGTTLNANGDIADFDGDGDPDIWVRVQGSNNDVYLRNDNGTYVAATALPGMDYEPASVGTVKVGDLNGDGLADIFYLTGPGGSPVYLQNNNGSSFSTPSPNPFSGISTVPANITSNTAMSLADMDGDGDIDIWSRLANAGNDFFARNNGTPPRLQSSIPANGAASIVRGTNITLNFSKPVFAGTGSFQIRRIADNSIFETITANSARVSGSGTSTIVIDPVQTLQSNTDYYLTFTRTALADAQGVIPGSLDGTVREPATTSDFLRFSTSAALPVSFGPIAATIEGGKLSVHFSTMQEKGNDYFIIEGSQDGISFTELGELKSRAVNGNSDTSLDYQFSIAAEQALAAAALLALLATLPLGNKRRKSPAVLMALVLIAILSCNKTTGLATAKDNLYIRITQVDLDGTKSHSKVIKVLQKEK